MGRGKRGRPKKMGERYPGGRLRPAHDRGNERIVALTAVFRPFQGGKADLWVKDSAIGRAWAVGLLDGFGVDASALRDAGLNYAARYWGHYSGGPAMAGYGDKRTGRVSRSDDEDPRGELFQRLDNAIRGAGMAAHDAVQSLCVDHHWFPQENPAWLDRLINERLVMQGRDVGGVLPLRGDVERLAAAVSGLLTVVQGKRRAA